MTALVPQDADNAAENWAALADALTLQEVLDRIAARKLAAEAETTSTVPRVIPVPPNAQLALKRLTKVLGATVVPSERRALTQEEAHNFIVLTKDVKDAERVLKSATAAVKAAVFNHLDVRLDEAIDAEIAALTEEDATADLPFYPDIDPETGHYLVEGELTVPETGLRFCRELRQASPDLTAEDMLHLYEAGKITRREYLDSTRQTRVLDEEGLLKLIQRDPSVLETLAEVIKPGKVTASFYLREVKKN